MVLVPASKVGLVIGKGGETIKSINAASGAFCEIDKKAPADAREKHFLIRGPPDAVERAKQMVLEKIGGTGYGSFPGQTFNGSNGGGGNGFGGGGSGPPGSGDYFQQGGPGGGQPRHRSAGLLRAVGRVLSQSGDDQGGGDDRDEP